MDYLFFHEKDLEKISQYSEILFGDPILCSNRFCSNLFSDCLFITIYSDENISLENFVMSLLGHVYLWRVKKRFYWFKYSTGKNLRNNLFNFITLNEKKFFFKLKKIFLWIKLRMYYATAYTFISLIQRKKK